MATATKLSAKEAAAELGTDARTLRKFIRASAEKGTLPVAPCGQGNRYEFTSKDIKALKKVFVAWTEGSTKKVTKTEKPAAKELTHEEPIQEVDPGEIDQEIEDYLSQEPDDEELVEIEEIDIELDEEDA